MMSENESRYISFSINGIRFEYDEEKNKTNIRKHGISFKTAARVFFDYDRIELYDEENSQNEDRYNTIGNVSGGLRGTAIGNIGGYNNGTQDILFVVYTERERIVQNGVKKDVIRLISARFATNFERGIYYGKH
ncbi:MAG: BrnT family toxin [Lachnospiraceae bacterium]|nr:BrnT family toxin [Lachnospiraceae bacterium]